MMEVSDESQSSQLGPDGTRPNHPGRLRLSICIATFKRGNVIGETLQTIASQLDARCELVVLDGASPDNTESVVREFTIRFPNIRYVRAETNSGVDQDYDKAVAHATADYCWLMTDDDLLVAGAVERVLGCLEGSPDLAIVNSLVRTADFSSELKPNLLPLVGTVHYDASDIDVLFADMATYLTFIGAVVIRRDVWLARRRKQYYGSCFIHVGVIFQSPPLSSVEVVREPLIVIRYGNAMWTPRGFEIWMYKWPQLVWSFEHISASARRAVCSPAPYRSISKLLWYRAIGGYSINVYKEYRIGGEFWPAKVVPALVARLPGRMANAMCAMYCSLWKPANSRMPIYEMARSPQSTVLTRALARLRGVV